MHTIEDQNIAVFNQFNNSWYTPSGNSMEEIEVKALMLDEKAVDRASPVVETTHSVSNLNNWGAIEVIRPLLLHPKPRFGEVRTLVALAQLIDEVAPKEDQEERHE